MKLITTGKEYNDYIKYLKSKGYTIISKDIVCLGNLKFKIYNEEKTIPTTIDSYISYYLKLSEDCTRCKNSIQKDSYDGEEIITCCEKDNDCKGYYGESYCDNGEFLPF